MRLLAFFLTTLAIAHGEDPWKRHTIDDSSRGADGVRLADVNGDGFMDVATGWEEGGMVRAYLHPGRGQERQPWPSVTVGTVKSPEDAVFVDLDGDGAVDVVSSCEGKTKTMYVHWAPKGDYLAEEEWETEAIPATAGRQAWMYALPMQVDGKHGIDLVTGSKGGNGAVGWLEAPADPRDLGAWKWHKLRDAGWIMSLIAADMDGDGDDDILVSNRKGPGRGVYWLKRGAGSWTSQNVDVGSDGEVMFISRGDIDQDGRRDVLEARKGSLVWFKRNGLKWEGFPISLPSGVGTGKSAAIADIDGDGKNDIVFSCENAKGQLSGMRWLSWNLSPRTSEWTSHEIGGPEGHKYDRVVLHDVDGDGDRDVLCCEERDGLGVFWYENPFGAPGKPKPQSGRPPNIVLIMADDVGSEVLGCYGGESYPTPHLDRLAAGGMRFEHAYSMAVCHPTRVCLMTGKYPVTLGNPKWGSFPKEEEARSVGNVLKRAGYRTAVAGKWQLGLMKRDVQQPARMGFDAWCLFGWHEGPRYDDPFIYQNGKVRKDTKGRFGPDLYTDFLVEFMRRSGDTPFFAYFPMALCHDVTDDVKEHVPFHKDGRWMSFAEMVKTMDAKVGEIVGAVDELGLADNTLILFTTDNGSPAGSYITVRDGKMVKEKVASIRNGRNVPGGKGNLNDRGTRVPLIASWKGTIAPGQVIDDLVDMSDYLPTLAEIAGHPVDANGRDGISFAPRLRGTGDSPRAYAFAEHRGRRFVRTRAWKLYEDGRFYHVAEDPEETVTSSAVNDAHAMLRKAMSSLGIGTDI